jgi:hypothetical protein
MKLLKTGYCLLSAAYGLLLTACCLLAVSCDKDDTAGGGDELGNPWMEVAPASISASTTANSYAFSVACGMAWTAAVDLNAALWCTLTDNSADGNGTVTVNVTENTDAAPRTATITVTAGKTTLPVTVAQEAATVPPPDVTVAQPPHAASASTWAFGTVAQPLVWSDVIRISDCNKTAFTNSTTVPQCRSYTSGGKTYYYYNWAYVNANKATMCPDPWRVPEVWDFNDVVLVITTNTLSSAWGYGGRANGTNIDNVDSKAWLWSSSPATDHPGEGWYLTYAQYSYSSEYNSQEYGFQVRCVH